MEPFRIVRLIITDDDKLQQHYYNQLNRRSKSSVLKVRKEEGTSKIKQFVIIMVLRQNSLWK